VAFLTDAIIMQRYVELDGRLERVMAVVKVRGSQHSTDIRRYDVSQDGIRIGSVLDGYEGLLSGHPSALPTPPSN
jgi:circadian clock protein KaiC